MADRNSLRIVSSGNIGYAPQYVGAALGLFETAGLRVELASQTPPGSTGIISSLRSGEADLALSSLLAAVRMSGEGLDPVLVAQSNQHIRHGILAREADMAGPFSWDMLRGSALVLQPSHIPTPWIAFRELLWQKGISLDEASLIIGFTPGECLAEFKRGVGRFLFCDLDATERSGLVELARVTESLGPIPWSVYCATRRTAERKAEAISGFRDVIGAAIAWLYANGPEKAAQAIRPFFAHMTEEAILARLTTAIESRMWPEGGRVAGDQLLRWQAALRRGGLIDPAMRLEAMVWPGLVQGALRA